jgi:hypothetical protein
MNNQLPTAIDAILASIDHFTTTDDAQDGNHAPRTLNIYIDIEEQEDSQALPPTIEGTVETPHSPNTTIPLPDEEQTEPPLPPPTTTTESHKTVPPVQSKRRASMRPHLLVLVVALVAVLATLIGLNVSFVFMPLFAPSASITIVTQSQRLTTKSIVELVTKGNADQRANQVPGRMVPTITMSQHKTIPTTGTTHQDAIAAHGLTTFYNSATYAQTIPAGTTLTGADGVVLITDTDAPIPAAVFPTFGQASVTAHAIMPGTGGNVRAGDVYGACCSRLNVSAVSNAFHGGQDARTYQSVTQQDITNGTTSIKTSLEQSVQAALQAHVQPSETLITPLACTSKVTPNHEVGEEATQVQVMVSETCTGTTYSTQALTRIATQRATQDAERRLGPGYTTTGLQTRITHVQANTHGTTELDITAVGVWTHPFSQEQQDAMKVMIAGMSKGKATMTLQHVGGVQSVFVSITKNGTTLPKDVQQIHVLFVQMS